MNTWQKHIQRASSVSELLAISREYLASWSPEALAQLPEACRPGRIKGEDDVFFWRDELVGEYCSRAARGDAASPIRDLLAYFSAAAERAVELQVEFDLMKTIPPPFAEKSIPRFFTSTQTCSAH